LIAALPLLRRDPIRFARGGFPQLGHLHHRRSILPIHGLSDASTLGCVLPVCSCILHDSILSHFPLANSGPREQFAPNALASDAGTNGRAIR
jgi:hypothetical protein